MAFWLVLITIFNFCWVLYLTLIVYKKNSPKNKALTSSNQVSDIDLSKLNRCFQKITITRFNPFENMGGDQSFILCLLDNTNSGCIVTSLHNRDNTRIYAKPIKNGEGDGITLSKEEIRAIVKTIKS